MHKQIFRFVGIRKKIIVYYLMITILLGATSLFANFNARIVSSQVEIILEDYVYLSELNNDVNILMMEVEKYLTTKSSEALLNYYTIYNDLQRKSREIPKEATFELDQLMLKNIGNMIDNLLLETDDAVRAKRGRISSEYIQHFTRANEINELIKYYISSLVDNKLEQGANEYQRMTSNMTFISYASLIIIIGSFILNIFLAIFFSYRLTRPIVELAETAEQISIGNFNVEPIKIETDDEVSVLARAFDQMVVNIRQYILEIKRQAAVETKLKEQEMENLKVKSLLKDAELKSLQSQINPHFLFNTLNAASQLSMMEGADNASEFIESIAELFRYNLRKLEESVSISEEINYVRNYMNILKTRFGNRIVFSTEIDETVLEVKMPCMIIQPIVENAFIHGLENQEEEGKISLIVKRDQGEIKIQIIDDGVGMTESQIQNILSLVPSGPQIKGHTTGIGILNVIDRLRLYYNISSTEDVIDIQSKNGLGTIVTLKIPYEGGVMNNG